MWMLYSYEPREIMFDRVRGAISEHRTDVASHELSCILEASWRTDVHRILFDMTLPKTPRPAEIKP